MSDMRIFGVEIENTIVIFEICVFEFVAKFCAKIKNCEKKFCEKNGNA